MKIPDLVVNENILSVIFTEENTHSQRMSEIVSMFSHKGKKVCYVCINKNACDVRDEFAGMGTDPEEVIFIDTTSSHYANPESTKSCIFLKNPYDLSGIKSAVSDVLLSNSIGGIIIDGLDSLLAYHDSFSVLHFSNFIKTSKCGENARKIYIMSGNDYGLDAESLQKDLSMLADATIFLSEKPAVPS